MPRPPKKNRPTAAPRKTAGGKRRPDAGSSTARRASGEPAAKSDVPNPADGRGERLQKVLAAAGVASRRECEELIVEGRVEVDGRIADELGIRVDPARQEIRVDGEVLRRSRKLYFAVNKPRGVVSTLRDPAGRPRVIDLLPPEAGRVFNVGRLDMESEGLILVTNDGELANKLTHPRHGVEKIYHVQVAGHVELDVLQQLRKGTHLADGFVRPVDVHVKSLVKKSTLLEMVLDEGRNREIRRLLARVGHKVQKLVRIAVGPVRLGEMPVGGVRPLTRDELAKLELAASGEPTTRRPPRSRPAKKTSRPTAGGSTSAPSTPRSTGRTLIGDDVPTVPSERRDSTERSVKKSAKSAGKPLGKLPKKSGSRPGVGKGGGKSLGAGRPPVKGAGRGKRPGGGRPPKKGTR